jgi:hypothetical protein
MALTAAACWSASAAELTATTSRENRTIVVLSGALAEGDANRFRNLMKTSYDSAKPVAALRLNSSGGSLIEGVRLAAVVQRARLATVIAAGATCAAACFIPFAAGTQRFVAATATVGVPGAADRSGQERAGDTPAVVRVMKDLGLLDAIVTKMLATPEGETAWLTLDDLRAMGATVTGKPALPR